MAQWTGVITRRRPWAGVGNYYRTPTVSTVE